MEVFQQGGKIDRLDLVLEGPALRLGHQQGALDELRKLADFLLQVLRNLRRQFRREGFQAEAQQGQRKPQLVRDPGGKVGHFAVGVPDPAQQVVDVADQRGQLRVALRNLHAAGAGQWIGAASSRLIRRTGRSERAAMK